MSKAQTEGIQLVATNKKARRDYEVIQVLEAGIALTGAEVKSVRGEGMNFKDSYVRIKDAQASLLGCHISPYKFARPETEEPERERKLLMHRQEIIKLGASIQKKGLTVIPLRAYFKNGRLKIELGVGRGKKAPDKREDIKARDASRDIERAFKSKKSN